MWFKLTIFCLFTFFNFGCNNCTNQVTTTEEKAGSAIHVSAREGKKWNVFGVQITGKIMSDSTNGEYAVIVTETPPNGGPPMHVHSNEDELFYVLKGNFLFNCGEEKMEAKQGDFIRLPKGIPHNFVNTDSTTGITMNTITPGGFERFFEEIAQVTKAGPLPKEDVARIAKTYGVTFIKSN